MHAYCLKKSFGNCSQMIKRRKTEEAHSKTILEILSHDTKSNKYAAGGQANCSGQANCMAVTSCS